MVAARVPSVPFSGFNQNESHPNHCGTQGDEHGHLVSSAHLIKGSQRSSPEDVLFLKELQKCFEQALSELSVLQRRVLHLRWVDDLAFDAIGLQTGQSSVAARMAFSRGQRRLLAVLVASDFPCSDACDYLSALDQESPG